VGGDTGGAVQVHLFNPSLSGTPRCLPRSGFLQPISPRLACCFPGSVFHILNLLFVRFLHFFHHDLMGLFLLLPPPCTPQRHFLLLCQRARGSEPLAGRLSQAFKSCRTYFRMAIALLFLGSPSFLLHVWFQS